MFFQSEDFKGSHFGVSTPGIIGEFHKPKGLRGFGTAVELKGPVFNSCSPGIPCVTPDTLRAVQGHAEIRFYGQPVFLGSGE